MPVAHNGATHTCALTSQLFRWPDDSSQFLAFDDPLQRSEVSFIFDCCLLASERYCHAMWATKKLLEKWWKMNYTPHNTRKDFFLFVSHLFFTWCFQLFSRLVNDLIPTHRRALDESSTRKSMKQMTRIMFYFNHKTDDKKQINRLLKSSKRKWG